MCMVAGSADDFNQSLEKAGRVADFFELAELMCIDALAAQRILRRPFPRRVSDARWRSAAQRRRITRTSPHGNTQGPSQSPNLHKEPLKFEYVHPSQRSYK